MTPTVRDRRRHARTALASAALVAALGLTACSTATPEQSGGASGQPGDASGSAAAGSTAAAQFGHVHGMGMDPAAGVVYVATHHGLFRSTGGALARVGDSGRDLMGFTVAGPGILLSSGHPGPGEQGPNPLGVIESRDAGETWTELGLGGSVDFHALEIGADAVYGYDATNGVLRASPDGGRNWETRGELVALDIAAAPSDPTRVLATVPGGVASSADGGRSFGAPTGPQLTNLSWANDGVVYGISLDGRLFASADRGASWQQTGAAPGGRPQALTAIADPGASTDLLIATSGGLYRSQDAGRSVVPLA
ncbi:exo-alpha-sialidase [Pseudonocardia sp. KRD-291]|nr:exo-alpha-sialidase [Pseudonocardia sp. KRD291]